ncbi:uncharacterized protein DUF268 [Dysgonomonas alginatilytica]|uniref:Uncharacterized protein DUF268 n=1 Tax=Dysgonomonas alginatilytica TaxID=1605892 RepID=A0A2V3PVX0_9BACT|nr:DUF268 domain-containing protein [Dysgonomonas alginatilytica]PXV69056.1 uncharacterized protein DUF268 [Dysgonomonas alginatilytica]
MIKEIQLIFGLYPRRIIKSLKSLPWYRQTKRQFVRQWKEDNQSFGAISSYPCLRDRDEEGGVASGHYFHQDLLVAQEVFKANPVKHVDVGSRINGFIAHVASFRQVTIVDIRSVTPSIENVEFVQADCMSPDFPWIDYCDSASSLHAIEHFGLGRYGDPIDVNGHIKGLNNISRMLKSGGTLYFSVPIGLQRIEFNAHRIFSIKYLLDYFAEGYNLESFSYVDDKGDLHKFITLTDDLINRNCDCKYGCGIFILTKK